MFICSFFCVKADLGKILHPKKVHCCELHVHHRGLDGSENGTAHRFELFQPVDVVDGLRVVDLPRSEAAHVAPLEAGGVCARPRVRYQDKRGGAPPLYPIHPAWIEPWPGIVTGVPTRSSPFSIVSEHGLGPGVDGARHPVRKPTLPHACKQRSRGPKVHRNPEKK